MADAGHPTDLETLKRLLQTYQEHHPLEPDLVIQQRYPRELWPIFCQEEDPQ